jgi:hypothetical protein
MDDKRFKEIEDERLREATEEHLYEEKQHREILKVLIPVAFDNLKKIIGQLEQQELKTQSGLKELGELVESLKQEVSKIKQVNIEISGTNVNANSGRQRDVTIASKDSSLWEKLKAAWNLFF